MKGDPFSKQTKPNYEAIIRALDSFRGYRVLVMGDIMVDEYLWGVVERISPEAPVQIVEVERQEYRFGGCGNVVNNLCSLGSSVSVASVIGDGSHRQFLLDELERLGVDIRGLITDSGRPTTKKTRVIAASQQVVRIDFESRRPISTEQEKYLIEFLETNTDQFDLILLSDYGKGLLTERLTSCAIRNGKRFSIPVVVDPKGKNFSKYRGATIITPNSKEAEIASNVVIKSDSTAEKAARRLLVKTKCDAVLITRGSSGMTLITQKKERSIHIPAQAREVFDVSGAGDTILAVLGLGMTAGLSFEDASFLANVAGGVVVGKLGTSAISKRELLSALNEKKEKGKSHKEKTLSELEALVTNLRQQRKHIVFTAGTFNQIQACDIELLQRAKRIGDILIVGINNDNTIRRLKGDDWPLINQTERVKILSALEYVDYVVIFEEDTLLRLLQRIRPDTMVRSNDSFGMLRNEMIERKIVEELGVRVDLIESRYSQSVR